MVAAGALAGAAWAAIPALLRAFGKTNEIITSLMLNYVAGLLVTYLIINSKSYWRDLDSFEGQTFPLGKSIPEEAKWPALDLDAFGGLLVPLGFGLAIAVAVLMWVVYWRTRFGFEVQVIGDSQRAARFAGMRLRRKILAVMCISGAIAGLGGAAFEGDFAYQIDPTGLQTSYFGYTGIVVAALARYNPLAVVPVAFLMGGLQNAGFTLRAPTSRRASSASCRGSSCSARSAARCSFVIGSGSAGALRPRAQRRRRPRRDRERQLELPRADSRLGGALRDAAPVRGARRAPGRALGSPQPRGRGDDARRRGDGLLGGAAPRRGAGASP